MMTKMVVAAARRVGQWWCGVTTGHAMVLKTRKGRMDLQCLHCLHEEPGWVVGPRGSATLDPKSKAAIRERARRRQAEWKEQRGALGG